MAKVRIVIKLRAGILDAEGQAVLGAIKRAGYAASDARVGKVVDLELAGTKADLEPTVRALADKVLVNPVMQDYEIEWL